MIEDALAETVHERQPVRGRQIDPRLPFLGANVRKRRRRNPELHERSPCFRPFEGFYGRECNAIRSGRRRNCLGPAIPICSSASAPARLRLTFQPNQILRINQTIGRLHMDRRNLLKALAGLAICPVCTTNGFAAEGAHWSYEGAEGPAKWGDLDAANKACSHRLAAIADRYRAHHQIPAAGAETVVGQDRRHHRQQRPHHSAQFRRRQHAEARRHHLQARCRCTSIGRANI